MPLGSIASDLKYELKHGNMVLRLIIVNAVVFFAVNLFALVLKGMGFEAIGMLPEQYLSLPLPFKEFIYKPWTLFSYMFMHYGPWHILVNMLMLYWFGKIFELYLGDKKLLPIYLWGGFVGGILSLLIVNVSPGFRAEGGDLMVGASGAVMAIVFAATAINPDHLIRLFIIGEVRIKYVAVVSLLIDMVSARFGNTGGYICHLGGAIMGYYFIKLLQNGTDLSNPFSGIVNLFKPKPKVRVTHKSEVLKSAPRKTMSDEDQNKVDSILDKISRSGYDSLTAEEKEFLFNYSKK
jgi:membrane associated rhomboid family serine protease